MIIECGPADDRRNFVLELPTKPTRIGVFVSGGLDSAIMYFHLVGENIQQGNLHNIIPFTIIRREGSRWAAVPVIQHVHDFYKIPMRYPLNVGDNTLPERAQVSSGMRDAWPGLDQIYAGLIEQLPQHLIGWDKVLFTETATFRTPLQYLNKSHIVDLIIQAEQECFFHITHSCCDDVGRCNNCNGCNEKAWGFERLGLIDPGRM